MKHIGTRMIETERLLLRQACPEDAVPMFRNWASDPEVTRYLMWPVHGHIDTSRAVVESWVKGYQASDFYQWMIVLKAIDEPIGTISVVAHDDRTAKAEVGYCIGRTWWHMGIVSEALLAVLEFLMNEVGVQRVEARHDIRNPHSGAVMKKCGMQYEGTSRAADWNNQGICDAAHYALLITDPLPFSRKG